MLCTQCGQENPLDAKFCVNCGHQLFGGHHQTPPPLTSANIAKPVHDASLNTHFGAEAADNLLAAFVGDKYDGYYREKWFQDSKPHLEISEKDRQRPKMNLAGFFLGVSWLSYRKMYKIALFMMLGISLLDTALMYVLGEQTYNAMSSSIFLGIGIVVTGLFGNYLYLRHSAQHIKKITASSSDQNAVREKLEKAGGTSWLGAIGFTLLLIIMSVLISYFLGPDWYWVE